MFSFFAFTGAFVSILFFCFMAASRFQDTALITAFFSILFSTIICFKLANMDKKIKYNENQIKILKKMNGLDENIEYEWSDSDDKKDE